MNDMSMNLKTDYFYLNNNLFIVVDEITFGWMNVFNPTSLITL